MPFTRTNVAISPLGLLTLAACGGGAADSGGGGGSPPSFSQVAAGKVEDGPLLNALAFLDYNDNGILDAGEPSDRTDITGGYSLTSTQANYSIVAVTDGTTVDQISGSVVSGVTLKAPSGASMVTPTTTLMEDGNLTAAQVVAVLICALHQGDFVADTQNRTLTVLMPGVWYADVVRFRCGCTHGGFWETR